MSIIRIVWAYFVSPRRRGQNFLLILGLSAGVMVLIASLGVMNVLQQEIIGELLDTQFHVQVYAPRWQDMREKLYEHPDVVSITPFVDDFVMGGRSGENPYGFTLRTLAEPLLPVQTAESEIVLTSSAATILKAGRGARVTAVFLPEDRRRPMQSREYQVVSVELSHSFDAIPRLGYAFSDAAAPFVLGVRLADYRNEAAFRRYVQEEYPNQITKIVGWRQLYQVLFTALRVEKITLILFVTFIFIIVAFAEYQLFQRSLIERLPHIAMLRANGVPVAVIRNLFLAEGALLGSVGMTLGAILGFLVSVNIPQITSALLITSYQLSRIASAVFSYLGGAGFFLELPVVFFAQRAEIFFSDIVIICVIAFFIPIMPVIAMMRRISGVHPREITRSW